MRCVADVMTLWPSLDVFCADVGVPVSLARVWKHRRNIPPERWSAIETAAERRAIAGASASDLARLAALRAVSAEPREAA